MSETIWKYELEFKGKQIVMLPEGAEILTVQIQREVPCMWVKLDPSRELRKRVIHVCGTGHPLDINLGRYVSTIQIDGGSLIFHIFERGMAV